MQLINQIAAQIAFLQNQCESAVRNEPPRQNSIATIFHKLTFKLQVVENSAWR